MSVRVLTYQVHCEWFLYMIQCCDWVDEAQLWSAAAVQAMQMACFMNKRILTEAFVSLAIFLVSFPNTSQRLSLLDTGRVTRSRCGC
jgi:hypothetical protein